jgi:HlyD family secretion protein
MSGREDIVKLLAEAEPRVARRWRWLAVALALTAAATGAFFLLRPGGEPATHYVTEQVRRGELVVTVSATGRLQPTNQVDVGSELSGTVESVLVDDNDRVKKGQVLARLDVSKLQDQVTKSRAALAAAQALLKQNEASEAEARANLKRYKQVSELSGGKVPSQAEMETAEATLARAVANVSSARASIAQADATLKSDQTNVTKASIRSPINGVVLRPHEEPPPTQGAARHAPRPVTNTGKQGPRS